MSAGHCPVGATLASGGTQPGEAGRGRVYLFGDVHGHFGHVTRVVRRDRPDAVIFLGDLECARPLEDELQPILDLTDIWFIHGNHDTEGGDRGRYLFGSALAGRNLHGRVADVAGWRVAGLGGTFEKEVWHPPETAPIQESAEAYFAWLEGQTRRLGTEVCAGRTLKAQASIFFADWLELQAQRADVLVSHEAPSCHPHGFREIDELALSLGVQRSFHGHHHETRDYRSEAPELGFEAFGVGYCHVTDMLGNPVPAGR